MGCLFPRRLADLVDEISDLAHSGSFLSGIFYGT